MVKPKNPFKVNTVRSIKLKNKAKAYVTQLKKLNEITKKNVADIDEELKTLQETVHQPLKAVKTLAPAPKTTDKGKANEEVAKEFSKAEDSAKEALNKFNKMELL